MRPFALAAFALALSPGLALSGQAQAAPLAASLQTRPSAAPHEDAALTSGAVKVAIQAQVLPVGGKLPEHRHDGVRYLYVVSGQLKVSNLVTGTEELVDAGKIATEAAGDWHAAEVVGSEPATFYVIDQVPEAAAATAGAN